MEPEPLVGREREFRRLCDLLAQCMEGHGITVLIGGEAGVGKTRIAFELMEYAKKQGLRQKL